MKASHLLMSAVALSAVGLAACSSSSPPKADPSTAPVSPSAAPTGTPAAAGGSASPQAGPDVCAAVPGARVASITKDVLRTTARGQVGTSAACTYTLSNSTIQVQVAPAGSGAAYAGFSALVANGAIPAGSSIPVPGLGQQSVSSSFGVATATAKWAILVVNQQGQVPGQLSADSSIAKAAISGLG